MRKKQNQRVSIWCLYGIYIWFI